MACATVAEAHCIDLATAMPAICSVRMGAASRAYYAMFQAAQVALEAAGAGRVQWSHAALQAAFTTGLIRRSKVRRAATFVSIVQEGTTRGSDR